MKERTHFMASKTQRLVLLLTELSLLVVPGLAMSADSLGVVADNVRDDLPQTMQLITAALFLTGVAFVGASLLGLKRLGGGSGGMGVGGTLKHPLLTGAAGIGLLYLTTVAGVGGVTVFGSSGNDVTIDGTTTLE